MLLAEAGKSCPAVTIVAMVCVTVMFCWFAYWLVRMVRDD